MPRRFDVDRYLRDYHTLTPSQREAVIRLVVRDAKEERAETLRRAGRVLAVWSWRGAGRGLNGIRQIGGAARRLTLAGWRRYQLRRRRRLAAIRLHGMDDRMLKDIGLNRGDIDYVVSGTVDPTRIARTPRAQQRRGRDPLAALRPKPGKQPAQRADLPLVLRNSCAG